MIWILLCLSVFNTLYELGLMCMTEQKPTDYTKCSRHYDVHFRYPLPLLSSRRRKTCTKWAHTHHINTHPTHLKPSRERTAEQTWHTKTHNTMATPTHRGTNRRKTHSNQSGSSIRFEQHKVGFSVRSETCTHASSVYLGAEHWNRQDIINIRFRDHTRRLLRCGIIYQLDEQNTTILKTNLRNFDRPKPEQLPKYRIVRFIEQLNGCINKWDNLKWNMWHWFQFYDCELT